MGWGVNFETPVTPGNTKHRDRSVCVCVCKCVKILKIGNTCLYPEQIWVQYVCVLDACLGIAGCVCERERERERER